MKRSNRLIMLMGVFLAAVAFVGTLALGSRPTEATPQQPVLANLVVAKQALSPGMSVGPDSVEAKQVPASSVPAAGYQDVAQVMGSVVRKPVGPGEALTAAHFRSDGTAGNDVVRSLKPGLRAIAIQVDAITGVGTLIQPGDHVDVVIALSDTDGKNPVVTEDKPDKEYPGYVFYKGADDLLNNTSVKLLVQNAEVLGTQTPPTGEATGTAVGEAPVTVQQPSFQVVILAVAPQDVEKIRFGQLDGNLSLVLRATGDNTAGAVETTGITLRKLVDEHGVLPPRTVETELP